jgi:hypothetical protein
LGAKALAGEHLRDLEAHLKACLDCCDKLTFSRQLDAFVKDRLPDSPVSPELQTRIREALRRP